MILLELKNHLKIQVYSVDGVSERVKHKTEKPEGEFIGRLLETVFKYFQC